MAKEFAFDATRMEAGAQALLYSKLDEWHTISKEMARLSDREKELRKDLASYFRDPKEGTNTALLGFGRQLKMQHRINRKIDEANLDAAISTGVLKSDIVNDVIVYKPNLSVSGWKALSPENRILFGDIITEEPGTPGLEIVVPKR